MMQPFTDNPEHFTVPLTPKMHQWADQFRRQQTDRPRAKQVYLNTLAVQAVQVYLSWFGIVADLSASESWDPAMQALSNSADLWLPAHGRLECRPILPGATQWAIPPEVWGDRLAYVAVALNADLTDATLLGFVTAVTTVAMPLSELRSLDDLFEVLEAHRRPEVGSEAVTLTQWLQGVVDATWQTLDDLLRVPQPAFSFRQADAQAATTVERGKGLNLQTPSGDPIGLQVSITPLPSEYAIAVQVFPLGEVSQLPPDLEVQVLDDTEVVVMQAQSRQTERLQLKFRGVAEERFSVRVTLGDMQVTERFVI